MDLSRKKASGVFPSRFAAHLAALCFAAWRAGCRVSQRNEFGEIGNDGTYVKSRSPDRVNATVGRLNAP